MISDLQNHLKKFDTNPYLFIGSGLSRRYLSLPTWEELLRAFFVNSEIPGQFEYYFSLSNGNLPALASNLADKFHGIWWHSATFEETREKCKGEAKASTESPFKIQLAEIVKESITIVDTLKEEVDFLKKSNINGIITTNWDNFLEGIFKDYKVYIGQEELLFTDGIPFGDIYKIHGCISKPQSMIVTNKDYSDFNNRNAYLAAKLLTIFVEHPIVFLGYSLSDENVQQIITSIVSCVGAKKIDRFKDRLIFVQWVTGSDFSMQDSYITLPNATVVPIKLITTDSFTPIFETLSATKRKIPIKLLRRIKSSIFEIVRTSEPVSKVFVNDIDSIGDDSSIEFVIGVGAIEQFTALRGYKPIETIEIIEDVLMDNKNYDAEQLLEHTFPTMLKYKEFIPVYKYLGKLGYVSKNGQLNPTGVKKIGSRFKLRDNIPNCFLPSKNYLHKRNKIREEHDNIQSILTNYDRLHSIVYILLLEHKKIDLEQLKCFLIECYKDKHENKNTFFKKLVCLYDFLKYGQ